MLFGPPWETPFADLDLWEEHGLALAAEVEKRHPRGIVISPGPGGPRDAGISIEPHMVVVFHEDHAIPDYERGHLWPGTTMYKRSPTGEYLVSVCTNTLCAVMGGDAIYDELSGLGADCVIVDPVDPTRRKHIPAGTPGEDLLVPVFRGGRRVYAVPPLAASRALTAAELERFHAGIKRFVNPHRYPAGLERTLFDLKTRLIIKARRVPE